MILSSANTTEATANAVPDTRIRDDSQTKRLKWSDPFLILGILTGGVLTGVGMFAQMEDALQTTVSTLIICSGLGIVFGAFLSTATVQWKGIVVTGVAGISIVLLGFVNYLMRDQMVRLTIGGDVTDARTIELIIPNKRTYAAANYGRYFEFVISGRDIVTDMQLAIIFPQGSAKGVEVPFDCVPKQALSDFVGKDKPVEWRFDANELALLRVKGAKNGQITSGSRGTCAEEAEVSSFANLGFSLIPSAYAQSSKSIPTLLKDLESDSATVRYAARKDLAAMGVPAVAPMTEHWQRHPTYRTRLGVSVALAEFLRSHKDQRQRVSRQITDAQLALLLNAAIDPDRTLRIYASEFLYDLRDKRIIKHANVAFDHANDDGKYNLALLMRSIVPEINTQERAALAGTLNQWKANVGPKTARMIDSTAAQLPTGTQSSH